MDLNNITELFPGALTLDYEEVHTSDEEEPQEGRDPAQINSIELTRPPRYFNKLPPVYINVIDFGDSATKAQLMVQQGIDFKPVTRIEDRIRVITASIESYKNVIKLCQANNWSYFTYGLPRTRRLKVCVRGLPSNVDLDAVKGELLEINIPVCRAHHMHTTPNIQRPSYIMLVCRYTEKGLNIFKVNTILGYSVTVERLIPKVGQCHRCQKWGHSQRYCLRPPKCVKCAGSHFTSKCKKTPEEPPMCVNCCEYHTANYRKCPIAVQYANKNEGRRKM